MQNEFQSQEQIETELFIRKCKNRVETLSFQRSFIYFSGIILYFFVLAISVPNAVGLGMFMLFLILQHFAAKYANAQIFKEKKEYIRILREYEITDKELEELGCTEAELKS